MIKSMTGYGRAQSDFQGTKITVEIRAVNHRYHEIMFKMSKDLIPLEDLMKKKLQSYVKRGRIDVFITIDNEENPNQQLKVDWDLMDQYIEIVQELNERINVESRLDLKDLLAIPELIHVGQDILDLEVLAPTLIDTLDIACKNLTEMRMNEGIHLYNDLTSRIGNLTSLLDKMQETAPQVVEEYRKKLVARITEWLDGVVEIDEARLLNEVAFFTDKANIDEEITRLKSHFNQFLSILSQDEPVGRKLDFLIQEMNREINTIGSKANNLVLSQLVVEMKSELEKMREQVQNVE
ncbi:YicC family protein [Vulcanibacillus modesticaldus]|uniref:YicC family protein n=1 Tax=Vulcanibacillus modesticaldus TaxID=337097 RepID=A0A1D2YTQ5_9BACI|nr:YicC/YloC family endoribonuclease [Vulcanibacillus modesticaldus]OEF99090.1 YicC family protein [Vulcanibacillus modesticaldus]